MIPLQQAADSTEARRVAGHVVRGLRTGPKPVEGQWVILHRVGPDRAGPLDSMRTARDGAFGFRYHTSGDTTAVYFVSTTYGGVAYFTSPLRGPVVRGDDAMLTVFDTTSGPVAIKVGGRHLIIGLAQPNGRRPVGEVYDLQNDSTVTVVARDSLSPVFTTHIPPKAVGFQMNSNGDVAGSAVVQKGGTIGLLVPVSPGIRQFAFTYELPADAFPLSVPLERPTGVLEVLVQDARAHVTGPLREMAPVNTEGRAFRRFLGQDLKAEAAVRIELPLVVGREREKVYIAVATVVIAAMVAALLVTARRSFSRVHVQAKPEAPRRSEALLQSIANLDEQFERTERTSDEAARAAYAARRATLKTQLMDALAEEKRRR